MAQIFISYAQHDHARAAQIKAHLEAAGFGVWMLDEGAGFVWREEIDRAIRASAALIVIMSEAASVSPFVAYEWAVAWGADLPVIPIVLGPAPMHPRLDALHPLDFSDPERMPWAALDERLSPARQPAPETEPLPSPPAPISAVEIVQVLGELLGQTSADPSVRQAAAEALGLLKASAAVPALLGALGDPAPEVRAAAAAALGAIGDPSAAPALRERLSDEIEDVRARSAAALGAIRDAEAAPGLLAALHDPDGAVRWWAGEALAAIGSPAVAGLAGVLSAAAEPIGARLVAARTLGAIGDPAAITALAAALRDGCAIIRDTAAETLRRLDAPAARAALEEAALPARPQGDQEA